MRSRQAFTLLEVLLALVVIDVALLALVAAGGVLLRHATGVRIRVHAVLIAENRLQTLGATPCAAVAGSGLSAPGVREHWSADAPIRRVRVLRDSVTFTIAGAPKLIVLTTRLPC